MCPTCPTPRDLKWQELYHKFAGKIDEQFAFLAFRTAPLVAATTMDAKVVTADMASRMMVWADFGRPNQREWVPSRCREGNLREERRPLHQRLSLDHRARRRACCPPAKQPVVPRSSRTSLTRAIACGAAGCCPPPTRTTGSPPDRPPTIATCNPSDLDHAMEAHWAEYRSATAVAQPDPIQQFAHRRTQRRDLPGSVAPPARRRSLLRI